MLWCVSNGRQAGFRFYMHLYSGETSAFSMLLLVVELLRAEW
jgi:hypothetical protein